MPNISTVDEYIAQFPPDIQQRLQEVRQTIREAAPQATEKISYQMPTYHQGENLIHFAAAKHHIGLYPSSSGVAAFADRLTAYRTSPGAIQFPLDQPLPLALIRDLTLYRLAEAQARKRR